VVKQVLPALVLAILATVTFAPSIWARPTSQSMHHSTSESVFLLSVDGPVNAGDTFWVAYGPLVGTWGIIRLHAAGLRLYEARVVLPRGRTVFSFVKGTSVMHTRLGLVPGNPVATIRQVGPTSASGGVFPPVVWHEPMG
jgi:hypothetical protein